MQRFVDVVKYARIAETSPSSYDEAVESCRAISYSVFQFLVLYE